MSNRIQNPAKYPVEREKDSDVCVYFTGPYESRGIYLIDFNLMRESMNGGPELFQEEPWVIGYLWTQEEHCLDSGATTVVKSAAVNGWGPFLYECGMSLAFSDGYLGMIPDRTSVSPEARSLWQRFKKREDIEIAGEVEVDRESHCDVWDQSFLNMIYAMRNPWNLRRMKRRFKSRVSSELSRILQKGIDFNLTDNEFEYYIQEKGDLLFSEYWDREGRD